jgi:hypothetical protein
MKIFYVLVSLLFCINLNAQNGKLFLSKWQDDGNTEVTIPSDKYSYFKKGKLYYFLSNDNVNVNIFLNVTDLAVQNRILKQGLTIWINMDSKPGKKMGVHFPIGSQNSSVTKNSPKLPDDNLDNEASLLQSLSLAKTIDLIGFISEEERHFPADNYDTFRGSITYDKGTLFYKLVMPITKLPVRNSKDHIGAMPFTLGIDYGPPVPKPPYKPVLFWIKNIKLANNR